MNFKDYFSLGNLAFGVMAALFSLYGLASYPAAVVLIALAVVFDYLDGKIARSTKPDEFGKQLDSLCDMVSFGVCTPLVAAFFFPGQALLTVFGVVVFACSSAVRLVRFNLQQEKGVFYGLPTPAAALLLLLIAPFATNYLFALMAALGLLMVSGFKVRKL